MNTIKKISISFALVGLLSISTAIAGTISGPSPVTWNSEQTYSYFSFSYVSSPVWTVSSATILSSWSSGTTYYVRVRWNVAGNRTLYFKNGWSILGSKGVVVNGGPPAAPPAPTGSSSGCGSVTLSRSSPPSGVTYYWQGKTSNGTSTSSSGSTYVANQGSGNYYLRARSSGGVWGGQSYKYVTINSTPSIPPTPSVNTGTCGSVTLTRANPPSGHTYYWQSASNGTSTSSSSTTKTLTSGSVYYLRSRNNSSGCWSSTRMVTFSINTNPSTPPTPSITNNCGNTVLTRANPPSGITYYWQSSSSGTSTSSSGSSVTRTSGTVYYLRARNNSSGCWSTSRTISYTVHVVPATPSLPSVTNNCGNTVLTRGTPPSGFTYYWQSSSGGTSTSNSSSTITRTSGTIYYIRSRHNVTGCWGNSRSVSYSVYTVPSTPPTPSVTNNCGSTVLTRANPPSGYTYYWQSSSSGTSTSSSSLSVTRTSGTVYYLRSRNNSTGCWSSIRSVSYSVNSVPSAPPVPSATNNCGNTVLTRANPPSGITYYWQSSSGGTSTTTSSSTVTRTSGSIYYLRARNNSSGCWSTATSKSYTINTVPSTPPVPTVVNNCGNTVLTRANPPGGYTYYWQSSSSGTSTASSLSTKTLTSGTVHYLRSRNNTTYCWSAASSVSYTVNPVPATPSAPTITNHCGSTDLTRGTPPSGYTYYWQSSAGGTSLSNTSATVNMTSGTTYYIRSKSNTTSCWGSAYTVNYVVNQVPTTPPAPTVTSNCGSTTLTRANPVANHTYYWQSSAGGTSISDASLNKVMTSGTVYHLRSRHNLTLCWGASRTVNYTVTPDAGLASGSGNSRCGAGGITLTASPGSNADNIKWYAASTGGTVLHTGANYTISSLGSTTTYYAASYDNTTGCEDADRHGITATVYTIPTVNAGADMDAFLSSTLTLSGESPSGGTWSGTGVSGSTFTAATAGTGAHTITYSYTDGNGCNNIDTRTITVGADPVVALAGNTGLAIGESATLSVAAGYTAYQWKKDGVNISGATANSYQVSDIGAYKVEVTNASSLTWESAETSFTRKLASDENHIITWSFKQAGMNENAIPEDVSQVNRKVDYFDGLGRPIQTVVWQASPGTTKQDLVQPTLYDEYGRVVNEYLPYTGGITGLIHDDFVDADDAGYSTSPQYLFYNNSSNKVAEDTKPYSAKLYENSPLNRVVKQGAPGTAWQPDPDPTVTTDKVVRFTYNTVSAGEVKFWTINSSGLPESNTTCAAGSLYENSTADEEGNEVVEYKDKKGRVILKKVETGDGTNPWAQTYYIYDDFDNLRFVLPPMIFDGNETLDTGELDNYAFQYKYDSRQRMVEKKVPGAGWVYMVYDGRDRLVMTQDANQRADDEWTFSKYDHLNRPVSTGIYTDNTNTTRALMQTLAGTQAGGTLAWYETRDNNTGNVHGYDNASFPNVSAEGDYLTVSYYNDYAWNTDTNFDYANPTLSHTFNGVAYTSETVHNTSIRGQSTGGKVKNLADGTWLKSLIYYDDRYRVIQTISANNVGYWDKVSMLYDFTGKVLKSQTVHNHGGTLTTILRTFNYDHADRLLTVKHKIDSEDEITIVENEYNALGELVDKKLHSTNGTDYLQSVDYRYNIRGWMTSMNNAQLNVNTANNDDDDDFFGFELAYNDAMSGVGNTQAYNGNISAMAWSDFQQVDGVTERAFSYSYDAMNRLTAAQHHTKTTSTFGTTNDYGVSGLGYDLNGNINALTRKGKANEGLDNLTYTYANGNQLSKVDDSYSSTKGFKDGASVTTEYEYDANGNMIKDLNKGIDSIYYNYLNLPYLVDMANAGDSIEYEYDAAGIKLRQKVYEGGALKKTTDYVGEFIYNTDTTATRALQFIQHEEGRTIRESEKLVADIVWSFDIDVEGFGATKHLTGFQQASPGHLEGTITGSDPYFRSPDNLNFDAADHDIINIRLENNTSSTSAQIFFTTTTHTGESESKSKWFSISPNSGYTDYVIDMSTVGNWTGTIKRLRFDPGNQLGSFKIDEIVVMGNTEEDYVYQYHLKDHLGNTRATFTSGQYTSGYLATMEDANHTQESADFYNLDPRVAYPPGGKAVRLNSAAPIGPALGLAVSRGDTINMSVKAYYEDLTGHGTSSLGTTALAAALTGAYGGVNGGTEGQQLLYDVFNVHAGAAVAAGGTGDDAHPAAYLNYLVFDSDNNLVSAQTGYVGINEAPNLEQTINVNNLVIEQVGFIYIYVSNESSSTNYVYFDNLDVSIKESPVIENTDYYPFGLSFNSYTKPGLIQQNYKYNSKELIADLDLGWYDYQARYYDPALGRWHVIDPLADIYDDLSPYHYVDNNPIRYVDPDGRYFTEGQIQEMQEQGLAHTVYDAGSDDQPQQKQKKKDDTPWYFKKFDLNKSLEEIADGLAEGVAETFNTVHSWFKSKQTGDTQKNGHVIGNADPNSPSSDPTRTQSETETGQSIDGNVYTLVDKGGGMGKFEAASNTANSAANFLNSTNAIFNEISENNATPSDGSTSNTTITRHNGGPNIKREITDIRDYYSLGGNGSTYTVRKTNIQTGAFVEYDSSASNLLKKVKGRAGVK